MKHTIAVLISCTKKKREIAPGKKLPAVELYSASPWFQKALLWTRKFYPGVPFYILSTKFGLLSPERLLPFYECSGKFWQNADWRRWGVKILDGLRQEGWNLQRDRFVILAGKKYWGALAGNEGIVNYTLPLSGLRQGEQLALLKKSLL